MSKVPIMLSALVVGSVVTAFMYAREAQRERARADVLAERVFELEPVEKGTRSAPAQANGYVEPPPWMHVGNAPESTAEPLPVVNKTKEPKTVMEFEGTLRARRQVERLQRALTTGTPLQDYQIQALITAIDDVHSEMELEQKKAGDSTQREAETSERIIEVAADILFESQLEVFIPLLRGEQREMEAQR